MAEKVNITLQAATLRYKRHLAKCNKKLITFRKTAKVGGRYGIVDLVSKTVFIYGTENDLIKWIEEAGMIKQYETIEI